MKCFSKSLWIWPAAWGAVWPLWSGQAEEVSWVLFQRKYTSDFLLTGGEEVDEVQGIETSFNDLIQLSGGLVLFQESGPLSFLEREDQLFVTDGERNDLRLRAVVLDPLKDRLQPWER